MKKKDNCKHHYEWVSDNDRRIICRKCKTIFVIDDGRIVDIDKI